MSFDPVPWTPLGCPMAYWVYPRSEQATYQLINDCNSHRFLGSCHQPQMGFVWNHVTGVFWNAGHIRNGESNDDFQLGTQAYKIFRKITTGAIKKTPWFFRVYFWGWNPAQVSRDNNKPWIIYKDLRTLNNQDFMLHVMDLFEGSKTWVMQKSPSKMRAMSLSSYLQQSYLSAPRWLGRGVGGGCFFCWKITHTKYSKIHKDEAVV